MWYVRRIMRISRTEKTMMKMAGYNRSLGYSKPSEKDNYNFFFFFFFFFLGGHINRAGGL